MTDSNMGSFQRPTEPEDAETIASADDDFHDAAYTDVKWTLASETKGPVAWGAGNIHVELDPDADLVLLLRPIDFDYQIRPRDVTMLTYKGDTVGCADGCAYGDHRVIRALQASGKEEVLELAWALSRFYPFVQTDTTDTNADFLGADR